MTTAKSNSRTSKRQRQRAFLKAYASAGNLAVAAQAADVDRSAVYRWQKEPKFADQFEQAREEAADRLEAEALRRARSGVDEPVFYRGVQVGSVRKYSDTLLIFLLKAARPEKFRDRASVEHSGPGGGPITTQYDGNENLNIILADPELREHARVLGLALAKRIEQRGRNGDGRMVDRLQVSSQN